MGLALLVSVGYIDPGNWATDLEGGTRFGYGLLWVLVASSAMAVLLQALSARLGIVSGLNLAEACRAGYSARVNVLLWVLAEVGIVACDAAEVVGSAIALNLLFGVPLIIGSVLTALDVLVVLVLQHRRLAVLQACIGALLVVIAACLSGEMLLVRPSSGALVQGFVPRLPPGALYTAIGILGATLMPHNLYLQSALTQGSRGQDRSRALRESWVTTAVALNVALLLNVAILLLSAEAFSTRALVVTDLRDAHRLFAPLLGTSAASVLFATGLLCSGQSATVTGTLAGQIVMEGFIKTRLPAVVRRAVTRCAAVVPAVLVLTTVGSSGMMPLLVGSQVILSLQLPFAIVPLLRLTNCPRFMGRYANHRWMRGAAGAVRLGGEHGERGVALEDLPRAPSNERRGRSLVRSPLWRRCGAARVGPMGAVAEPGVSRARARGRHFLSWSSSATLRLTTSEMSALDSTIAPYRAAPGDAM